MADVAIDYKMIKRKIEKLPYFREGFYPIQKSGRLYYYPSGKSKGEEGYRDHSILALYPYICKIAELAARKFVTIHKENGYMTIDDFIQDIFEALLVNWERWKPEKFELSTMAYRLGLYWIFNSYKFKKISRSVMQMVSKFVTDEGFTDACSFLSGYDTGDNIENGTYYINKIEDKIDLDLFLQEIKDKLDTKEYKVFHWYFIDGLTYREIANILEVSAERVRQIMVGYATDGSSKNPHPESIKGIINKLKEKYI